MNVFNGDCFGPVRSFNAFPANFLGGNPGLVQQVKINTILGPLH